jgi:hypothetical protein
MATKIRVSLLLAPTRFAADVEAAPEWMTDERIACGPGNTAEPHLWTSEKYHELQQAAAICRARCPRCGDCGDWADDRGESHNVWGGRVRSKPRLKRKEATTA